MKFYVLRIMENYKVYHLTFPFWSSLSRMSLSSIMENLILLTDLASCSSLKTEKMDIRTFLFNLEVVDSGLPVWHYGTLTT